MAEGNQCYVVLSSGGDAPGMNASIRAVVRTAIAHNIQILGAEMGFEGLINQQLTPLTSSSVANCIQRGGTLLKSARSKRFRDQSVRAAVIAFLKESNVTGLIVLGGNGSFQGAMKLHEEGGPPVIGIPCTIDNDIAGTEYCIGFDTCCNTALAAIDKIRDTARSVDSDFLIEVMGRASGFIAAAVGVAGGAELIILPEFPLNDKKIIEKIQEKKRKKLASIIVAAESDHPGWTLELAKKIKAETGHDYRVCILGHTQRGGAPTVKDRLMASQMGYHAVELLEQKLSGKMVAWQQGKITHCDFILGDKGTRFFTDQELLIMNDTLSRG